VSIFRGSLTYVRFFVTDDVPDGFEGRALGQIQKKVQRPLTADDDDAERSGWCKVADPFGLELEHMDVFYNEYVNLGFRTDRWAIPGALLKSKVGEAEQAYLAKKGRERLSRKEKTELKELVARKLRRNLVPQVRVNDMSWATNEGIVRFFGTSPRVCLAFTDLFTKTFGLSLVQEAPYTLADRLGLSKAEAAALAETEPQVLSKAEED
jgi:recombination associated protein RdgC